MGANTAPLGALVVTDVFPPNAEVGVHRVVALCRHLVGHGWQVTVVTPRPRKGDYLDEAIGSRVPDAINVVRTYCPDVVLFLNKLLRRSRGQAGAAGQKVTTAKIRVRPSQRGLLRRLIDWWSWWLYVPDRNAGWFLPAVKAGLMHSRHRRPDVIFATAPGWTSLLVGATLSRILRVPWIADFRDPWCESKFSRIPHGAHQRASAFLEKTVIRTAARITCAWDGIRRLLAERYPGRIDDIQTILNGFDPEQIDPVEPLCLDTRRCVLLHAGSLYGPRSPEPLLAGLRILHQQSPDVARRLLVVFLGGTTYNGRPLSELVQEHGLADHVRIVPPAPHQQAVALLKGADLALLLGQSGEERLASVPAKAYEYIGAGKSVLAVGAGDEVCELMSQGGCHVWRAFAEPHQIASTLRDILAHNVRYDVGQAHSTQRLAFTSSRMTRQLESVMQRVVARRYPRSSGGGSGPSPQTHDRPGNVEVR